jgi:8-oxo-dGTP diphosphatase
MDEHNATTAEAAEALNVHLVTLQRWAKQGIVTPAFRTAGGRYRWDIPDLRRQLREKTGAPMTDVSTPIHPPIVAAIVTSKLGVLVERRHDGRPLWTFPAGEAEPGESPADTAIRETKEETTLEIKVSHVIGERDHPKTGRHMIYVAARPYQGTEVHVGDEDELAEVRWVNLGQADELLSGMFGPVREHLGKTIG